MSEANRLSHSAADNRKSKIENLKWLGIAVAFAFILGGAMAHAQQPKKVARMRIGYLVGSSASSARYEAFRQGLRELGYMEGKILSSNGELAGEIVIARARSWPNCCVSR
jgi:hypothetical protein